MPTPPLDLETLLSVPRVDDYTGYDVSPDGQQVAFAWNRSGRWEIVSVAPSSSEGPCDWFTGVGMASPEF